MDAGTCRHNNLPSPLGQLTSVVADDTFRGYGKDGASLLVFAASLYTLSSHQLNWQSLPDMGASAGVTLYNKYLLTVGGRYNLMMQARPGKFIHLTQQPVRGYT